MNEKDAGGLRQRQWRCGSRSACRVERELPAVPFGPDYSCGADHPLPLPSLLPKKNLSEAAFSLCRCRRDGRLHRAHLRGVYAHRCVCVTMCMVCAYLGAGVDGVDAGAGKTVRRTALQFAVPPLPSGCPVAPSSKLLTPQVPLSPSGSAALQPGPELGLGSLPEDLGILC